MAAQDTIHDAKSLKALGLKGIDALPELPPDLGKDVIITPEDKRWQKYYFRVSPRNLEHLKRLAGVTSEITESRKYKPKLRKVRDEELPEVKRSLNFAKLEPESQQSVLDTAHNLLFGHADAEISQSGVNRPIVNYMLREARDLPVFGAAELIVLDGERRVIDGTATLVVDRIAVYGTGEIKLKGQIKIIAKKVEYYPDQKS
jgi:hypothetical protein